MVKIQCFDKKNLKLLLLIHSLTVLAENLHKGTSQGCNKFDGSELSNFSKFIAQIPIKMVIFANFGTLTCYK